MKKILSVLLVLASVAAMGHAARLYSTAIQVSTLTVVGDAPDAITSSISSTTYALNVAAIYFTNSSTATAQTVTVYATCTSTSVLTTMAKFDFPIGYHLPFVLQPPVSNKEWKFPAGLIIRSSSPNSTIRATVFHD